MNLRVQLNDLARWTGVVGWLTIIGGAISALGGLFAYIVGAIPGIITVILGIKLINARKHALNISLSIEENVDPNMNGMVRELAMYFKIQGILQIIGIVLCIFALLVVLIGVVVAGMSFMDLYGSSL
ncbi:MAG: DUF5362 family protein [Caldicoprobacter sp.]|uniref:DUF5362 family protein n=1 Tax=Caldicoprobacter sp. TaxID=2004500 RepID=UPI001DC73AFE|nr:hypothetical protein [Clostridia bacterium]